MHYLKGVAQQAQRDRHTALAQGASSKADPAWCAASLVELWANAKIGAELNKISVKNYERIDAAVFNFVMSTLGPEEVARVIEREDDSDHDDPPI